MRQTRGTEISKYLQEEKSTEISVVATSETEIAQTHRFSGGGCGAAHNGYAKLVELFGKTDHRE